MPGISLPTHLFLPGWTLFAWPNLFLSFEHRGYTQRSHVFPIPTRSQFSRDCSWFGVLAKDLNLHLLSEVHGLGFTIFSSVSCKRMKLTDICFVSVMFRDSEKKGNGHMWHSQTSLEYLGSKLQLCCVMARDVSGQGESLFNCGTYTSVYRKHRC